MTRGARIASVLAGTAVTAVLVAYYIATWVVNYPPAVDAASAPSNDVTLQTVAAYGHSPHSSWVSYYVKQGSEWRHSTVINLPAHSLVHITIINFDGQSGLRNPLWARPIGVVGGITVDGKPTSALDPDAASHSFAVPDLGISVPVLGVGDNAPNQCATAAPCPIGTAHTTTTFTIRTGAPGHYRWQCFVPCAAGFINGFGGPMQTVGFMDGYLNVA